MYTNIESVLQEIATEMAFLVPDRMDGLSSIAQALDQLSKDPVVVSSSEAGQEVVGALQLCNDIISKNVGIDHGQLAFLHAAFESLSSTIYLAKPHQKEHPSDDQALDPLVTPESPLTAFSLKQSDDKEMLNEFCIEGRELLLHVEQGVLKLEENPRHKETLNQVFRAFHNFKGGAGFLGIEPIKDLAHQLESLLDAARKDELPIDRHVIEMILAGGDALQRYIDAIAQQLLLADSFGQPIHVATASLMQRVQQCLSGQKPTTGMVLPDVAEPLLTAPVAEVPQPARGPLPTEPTAPLAPMAPMAASPQSLQSLPLPLAPPAKETQTIVTRQEALASFVKLDSRKLDALVDLMGELVIAQSMVVQHPQVQTLQDRELDRHLRQLSRITSDLQHNAMSLRMVPIRSVFQKMMRLVRDLAAAQNKQVQLHLSGEDTELDRNIVEELADPLLHMMRNAVDHGIESPEARVRQGKSAQGNIYLHAAQLGGGILIRMQDDGRGLDSGKILSKALQRGLMATDSVPTEKDIYNLIFLPGFSTAETVTDVSGRGVGMDVVRGSINKLRGRVDIDSSPGEGTVFNIFLPLTLAIIDGMLVGVGSERFILPTLTIRESLRPQAGMVSTVQGKGEVICVRSKLIPLVRLSEKLGVQGFAIDPCDGIVVVVDSGARPRALLVDSLIGKQEVVIKPLGETFKQHKGMSGAAIMGDGRVALIIDPDAVSQLPSLNTHFA